MTTSTNEVSYVGRARTENTNRGFSGRRSGNYLNFYSGVAALACGLLVVAVAVLVDSSRISGVVSASAPLVVHLVFCRARGIGAATPSVSLIFSASYFVFFASGYLLLVSNEQRLAFRPGFVPLATANSTLVSTSTVTIFLCLGSLFTLRSQGSRVVSDKDRFTLDRAFLGTTALLAGLAFFGAAGTVAHYGSLAATIDAFTVHDRNNTLDLAGSAFFRSWSVFSLPAIIALEVCVVYAKTRASRVLFGGVLSLLLAIALLVFTSRLVIILALIAYSAVLYKGAGRLVRRSTVAVASVFFVIVSFILVSQRPGGLDLQRISIFQRLLQILNYGIVDVGMSASSNSDTLSAIMRSPARMLVLLESAVPGMGAAQDAISKARIDVVIARAVGTVAQSNDSALPPSLPFFLVVGFGLIAGCAVALVVGGMLSSIFNLLARPSGPIWTFFFGFYFAFLFNTFKGGDLPLDVASESRRAAYVLVAYAGVILFLKVIRVSARSDGPPTKESGAL